ncbi:UNVERIFIED_CONTAM: RING-H2 finger protein ATL2 [Sesamum radiatum]|uniref:RING-H2 finger protein ATL2 n=1 Tax=Sesamum radiatum TaxID=300843 RepID=A0AAW2V7H7_SESRA
MGSSGDSSGVLGGTGAMELTGKIMVVAIILLLFVLVFVFCLHLYARWFWYRRQENTTATTTRRRRRLDFAAGHQELTAVSAFRRGLDPCVLKAIPVITFDPKEFKDGLECAVVGSIAMVNEEEEQKSPLPTRFRSLKRLLSGNRRVNPSSPRNLDLEQGGRAQS